MCLSDRYHVYRNRSRSCDNFFRVPRTVFKIITAEAKFVTLVCPDILLQCIGNPDNIILSSWNSLDLLLERNSFLYEWSTINGT
jgi:hypothetical protein